MYILHTHIHTHTNIDIYICVYCIGIPIYTYIYYTYISLVLLQDPLAERAEQPVITVLNYIVSSYYIYMCIYIYE